MVRSSLRIDLSPLRDLRDFRLLFGSGLVTGLGSFTTYVAMPFQIADITGSYVAVGLLGVLEVVPLVVFGLWGGVLADRLDRKMVVVITEIAMAALVLVLFLNSRSDQPAAWIVYVVALLFAACDGLQRPSLDAILPRVVPADRVSSALALGSLRGNFANVAGPALGGILIAVGGVDMAYLFDLATFGVSVSLLVAVSRVPSLRADDTGPLDDLREALAYVRRRPDVLGTYLVDTIAMLMAFPFALFPFVATEFGADWSVGFLYSAVAVGSLIATLTSGWMKSIRHLGRAIVAAAFVWGIAIAMAGFVPSIWWVIACLAAAGAADMVSGHFRALLWNRTIPDELRGRMAGVELLSYSVGPQLGQVRSGLFARWIGLRPAFIAGGFLAASGVGAAALALPALWEFDIDEWTQSERSDHSPAVSELHPE